jgi:hypothetical protein
VCHDHDMRWAESEAGGSGMNCSSRELCELKAWFDE